MQHVRWTRGSLLCTAAVVAGIGVTALATPASADPGRHNTAVINESASTVSGDFRISTGKFVLSQRDGRYSGQLPVTISYVGNNPTASASVTIEPPAGLWLVTTNTSDISGCTGNTAKMTCYGPTLQPGEVRTYSFTLASWAGSDVNARITDRGILGVLPSDGDSTAPPATPVEAKFRGILRGSEGSLAHPVPYRPSTDYDTSISAGATSVTPNADGSLLVTVPLTVRYGTDAPNDGVFVSFVRPEGAGFPELVPSAVCTSICSVPGKPEMVSGEVRTFQLLFTMPAGTSAGTYNGTVSVNASTSSGSVTDVNPSDNTAPFEFVVNA